jgi:undecaprenyl-phosphate 4-deoxy-4-formamido-L-arabinose transferase
MRSEGLLSVVIPVYRSEGYLSRTVEELTEALAPWGAFEIVLVKDGSPDGVQRVIDDLCTRDGRIRQASLGRNVGQHRATLRGLAMARGDVVVTIDDDGQNPPSAVIEVAEALLRQDLDVVYGRFGSVEQSFLRRAASLLNRWLSRMTLGNMRDLAITNVRALRGDLARWLGASQSAYPYIDALIFRATSHAGEVPVSHRPRERGASTYSLGALIRLWLSHMTSLTVVPLRVAVVGSFSVSVLGFGVGLVQLVRALMLGEAPAGWLSLFCAVTFLFAILFAFLGIVSAYVGRMYVSMNERGLVWERTSPRFRGSVDSQPRSVG